MDKSALHWMMEPLRRYADFRGRSPRAEFWWWTLAYYAITVLLMVLVLSGYPWELMFNDNIDPAAVDLDGGPFTFFGLSTWLGFALYFIFALTTLVPSLAVFVRRLHDRGMSGWWLAGVIILNFIPILNMLAFFAYIGLLVICALPGQEGPNRWGPDPKDPAQASVFT